MFIMWSVFLAQALWNGLPRYSPAISPAQWKTAWQLLSRNWKDSVNFHNNLMHLSSSSDRQVYAYFLVDLPINSLVICNSLEVPVFCTNWKQSCSSHSVKSMESTVVPLASPGENAGLHWMLWSFNALMVWWTKEINSLPLNGNCSSLWFLINTFLLPRLFQLNRYDLKRDVLQAVLK